MRRDRFGEEIEPDSEPTPHSCRNGWLGDLDAPSPCPVHRPWLVCREGGWALDRAAYAEARHRVVAN
jgi:hypothetical protein